MSNPNRRRWLGWVALAGASVLLVSASVAALILAPHVIRPATETTAATAPAEMEDRWRPAYHLTPEAGWMNDPQRPILIGGVWHLYYLYNVDYPDGNGTAWYHVTSTDMVTWRDEGVAIDKYTNGLGDIETGSAVVDTANTAGYGAGAVIAVMTQQDEGVQRQSMFVSTDGGYTFAPGNSNPVLDNPGVPDFRDPKIVWDAERNQWLMVLAEGAKLGFYTSPDLQSWTYQSAFERTDLGTLECPDLFQMSVDGDPARTVWVLAASAHGENYGLSTGYAYWTGDWNGQHFVAADETPQWLDAGADFYAAVTWDDPRADERDQLASRYAIGWLNNWAYARDLPTSAWHGGALSVVRSITLVDGGGVPRLHSQPIDALEQIAGEPLNVATEVDVPSNALVTIDDSAPSAYRLRLTVRAADAGAAHEVRVHVKQADGAFTTAGYDFDAQQIFIARDADAVAAHMPDLYREVRTAHVVAEDGSVTLDVLVDAMSVELFAEGAGSTLSALTFGAGDSGAIVVEAVGGGVHIADMSLVPIPATVQR